MHQTLGMETSGQVPQSPQKLLEAVIPGYSLISTFFMLFSIDITKYVLFIAVAFGIAVAVKQGYRWSSSIASTLSGHFVTTAEVFPEDELFVLLLSWLSDQPTVQDARTFTASLTTEDESWRRYRPSSGPLADRDGLEHEEEEFNLFNEDDPRFWQAINASQHVKPLVITPAVGWFYFRWKGTFFVAHRQKGSTGGWGGVGEGHSFFLSCLGRNPQKLKNLLNDIRRSVMAPNPKVTQIYRGQERSGRHRWYRAMTRRLRPLDTVIIDESQKEALLEDMKSYMHPTTRYFYASRGIPYRRGYLLHGPPGTGKSSLSFALAGIFGLRLYVLSLSSEVDAKALNQLFETLPTRCLILLEDVDTAGIEKRDTEIPENAEEKKGEQKPDDKKLDEVAKQVKQVSTHINNQKRITLSTLLNVIDGVTSQEGRILIMTTNFVEKLDKALIRPGRVDMTIKFDYADRKTIASLFRAMFAPIDMSSMQGGFSNEKLVKSSEKLPQNGNLTPPLTPAFNPVSRYAIHHSVSTERIAELAEEIAESFPPKVFSPAEIQGFLLKYKNDPEGAVAKSKTWVEEMMKEKEEELAAREPKKTDEKSTAASGESKLGNAPL